MPSFLRIFRRDASSSKKQTKQNGVAKPTEPSKPQWTDAWLRTEVSPDEVRELLHGCTVELKARALDTPFLLLPFRPTSDPSASRTFIRHYFTPATDQRAALRGDLLMQELRLTEPMVLCSVMKWCWSRLPGGVVTWEAYELFKVGEQDSQFARDAFSTFIPISADSDARTKIIFDFFDLMAAIAAHGKSNGLGGRKLSRYAGWWAFEHADTGNGFETSYKTWASAADAASHLFFAYLRSQSPESTRGTTGITALPISLQALVQATEYPPEPPSLLRIHTTKVVMIVNTVSPTPFALLRRAKNFEYRDSDYALQEFSNKEDPVQALTDECLRVLKCISSTNQSDVSTSKASTSLRDASWSRFEDIGFGGTIEESDEDKNDDDQTKRPGNNGPLSLRSAPNSGTADLGRPTTPSWADFLSSGFADDNEPKGRPEFLLPPDKVLPPIHTNNSANRGQSSHSHKRGFEQDFASMEPGELASITEMELDDSFWWVWVSSLAGEETSARKAVFGRCALIETNISGGKWLVLEEQVKGAAPEPEEGAYIAEKKSFFGFRTKKGRLTRRKTSAKKSSSAGEPYKSSQSVAATSKSSIGPDQHARIQAAAAELQRKNREQEAEQEEESRLGRDDAMSRKTSSMLTLQPSILNEASQAMKWANNYDKNAVRAAYLSNSRAGTGAPAETLDLDVNGHDRADEASKPEEERKPSLLQPKEEEAPAPAPVSEPVDVKPYPVKKAAEPVPADKKDKEKEAKEKKEKEAREKEEAKEKKEREAKEKKDKEAKVKKEKKEAKDASKAGKEKETASASAAAPEPTPVAHTSAEPTPQAAPTEPSPKKSSESTDEHKKLKKKPGNTGLKGVFGKKKSDKADKSESTSGGHQQQQSSEGRSTVAATKAAIESRAAQAAKESTPQRSATPVRKMSEPQRADSPRSPPAATAPSARAPEEPPSAPEPTMDPSAMLPSNGPPRTGREEEFDNLSRVDTNEKEQAEREFATFDHQSPIVDQPAFVPQDEPSPVRETAPEKAPSPPPVKKASPPKPAPAQPVQSAQSPVSPVATPVRQDDSDSKKSADLPKLSRDAPSPELERAAEVIAPRTEAPQGQTPPAEAPGQKKAGGSGLPSTQEPIEARAARIRARVAELTKNMDSK